LSLNAQANQSRDIKVSITGTSVTYREIFNSLRKQTGIWFTYSNEDFNQEEKISISIKEESLDVALAVLSKKIGFTWSYHNRIVAIAKIIPLEKVPSFTISGRVLDKNDKPIPGATVQIKGKSKGTLTNAEGEFTLQNVEEKSFLLVSSVGYETKEIRIIDASRLIVRLKALVGVLDETVVIAYGTTTKRFNTGNVSTIKAEDIERQPISNPILALQGRIAGMEITQVNGLSGGAVKVQIRGRNTIAQGIDPLYIIDGVPYTSTLFSSPGNGGLGTGILGSGINPFSFLNPNDIESIDVLKDADATAIYGSRAANGVVLITTKKGKVGTTRININFQSGIGQVNRQADLMNTQQYLEMRKEAFKNDNVTPDNNNARDLISWSQNSYTNWQKIMIGGTANYTDVQSSISGGNSTTQFLIGSNYHKETTVFPGNWSDQKTSLHFNINSASSNQKFKLTLSGNVLSDNNQLPNSDFTQFITLAPNAPSLYNNNGTLDWTNYPSNAFANKVLAYQARTTNLLGNAVLSYRLLSGLDIKASLGYNNIQLNERNTTPIVYSNPAYNITTGSASFNNNSIRSWIIEPQLNYQKKLGTGRLNILIGATIQRRETEGQIINGEGYTNDALLGSLAAAAIIYKGTSEYEQYRYNSSFGRISYSLSDKYLFNLTARRDGSSRFGPGKQFGNFGSIGAGWIFSNENFAQDAFSVLSFGKLRASYGTTGNEPSQNYQYLELYNFSNRNIYGGGSGLLPNNLPSPGFAWEVIKKLEIGIELGVLKDHIVFTASYYRNRSSNQLVGYSLPSITGFGSVIANLPATIQNKGWEFTLNTINIQSNNFSWSSGFNLSAAHNKLLAFQNIENTSYKNSYTIGEPITYLPKFSFAGVDPTTGNYQFYDKEKNLTFFPSYSTDRVRHINITPKFYGGIQNSFQYRNFELNINLQYIKQLGRNYLFSNGSSPGYIGGDRRANQPVDVLNRWQHEGDNKPYQKYTQDFSFSYADYASASDIAYSDASFIRAKNISLSFCFSKVSLQKLKVESIKLYMQGQNLFTITNYKGVDPENQSLTVLPPLRVITVGIQIAL
jgi:TonB-linked SusC/RagA family outer membrane protein